jgi:hypothetical protein
MKNLVIPNGSSVSSNTLYNQCINIEITHAPVAKVIILENYSSFRLPQSCLSINKKTKQTLTKRIFLHERTIHKMPVAD